MLVIGVSILFFILLCIPFIPGIIELRRPRDSAPLFIDMEYTKDPRYFGKSFRSIMNKYVQSDSFLEGIREVPLSRREKVLVSGSRTVTAGEQIRQILCVAGTLISEENVYFEKEMYVSGGVMVGSANILKALGSEGVITLGRHAQVLRWVDSTRSIEVGEGSHLGVSLSSGEDVRIASGCTFKRLFGFPVMTVSTDCHHARVDITSGQADVRSQHTSRNVSVVPRSSRIDKDLIVKNYLRIEEDCVIAGNIKTYRGLVIGKHTIISGNIFSEEDITIGEHTFIHGNIFSQGRVSIEGNTQVGQKGQMKSVIGKTGINLGPNVCVYGYIMTEGAGVTR